MVYIFCTGNQALALVYYIFNRKISYKINESVESKQFLRYYRTQHNGVSRGLEPHSLMLRKPLNRLPSALKKLRRTINYFYFY